jgi:hypoxanthine phosphoribosyltransferase
MGDRLEKLLSSDAISAAVDRLAERISQDFDDEEIIFVCVLKGSYIFTADLARKVKVPSAVDFIRAASYGNSMTSSGAMSITKDLETDIAGKNVIIVEDIVDSGFTLKEIREMLSRRGPKQLKICALIDKKAARQVEVQCDYVGFALDDGFLVGYGLDYAEKYRNLPDIYVVHKT